MNILLKGTLVGAACIHQDDTEHVSAEAVAGPLLMPIDGNQIIGQVARSSEL